MAKCGKCLTVSTTFAFVECSHGVRIMAGILATGVAIAVGYNLKKGQKGGGQVISRDQQQRILEQNEWKKSRFQNGKQVERVFNPGFRTAAERFVKDQAAKKNAFNRPSDSQPPQLSPAGASDRQTRSGTRYNAGTYRGDPNPPPLQRERDVEANRPPPTPPNRGPERTAGAVAGGLLVAGGLYAGHKIRQGGGGGDPPGDPGHSGVSVDENNNDIMADTQVEPPAPVASNQDAGTGSQAGIAAGSAVGGTQVSGGMRTAPIHPPISVQDNESCTYRKRHRWIIKMQTANWIPTTVSSNSQTLDSDYYEVPDNEFGFYMNPAEISHAILKGRYFKVDDARWWVNKSDIIVRNKQNSGQTDNVSMNTQIQPGLKVVTESNCMPNMRYRRWQQADGTLANDQTFQGCAAKCALAHQGIPTFLPQIRWVLDKPAFITIANWKGLQYRTPGANTNDPGHIDLMNECYWLYEQNATGIGAIKKPMGAWRSTFANVYKSHAVGKPVWTVPGLRENIAQTTKMAPDYGGVSTADAGEVLHHFTPSRVGTRQINGPDHPYQYSEFMRGLIGHDKTSVVHQYRNDRDAFFPHMTKDGTNHPTFIAVERLPNLTGDSYEVYIILDIESELTLGFSTPYNFAFNLNPVGSNDYNDNMHGDDRMFYRKSYYSLEACYGDSDFEHPFQLLARGEGTYDAELPSNQVSDQV